MSKCDDCSGVDALFKENADLRARLAEVTACNEAMRDPCNKLRALLNLPAEGEGYVIDRACARLAEAEKENAMLTDALGDAQVDASVMQDRLIAADCAHAPKFKPEERCGTCYACRWQAAASESATLRAQLQEAQTRAVDECERGVPPSLCPEFLARRPAQPSAQEQAEADAHADDYFAAADKGARKMPSAQADEDN